MRCFNIVRALSRYISRSKHTKEAVESLYFNKNDENAEIDHEYFLKKFDENKHQIKELPNRESMVEKINKLENNHQLLKFYGKFKTFFGPVSFFALVKKINLNQKNLEFHKYSRVKSYNEYKAKKLLEDPTATVEFTGIFLNKKELANHRFTQEMENSIIFNLDNKKWELNQFIIHIILGFLKIKNELSDNLKTSIINSYMNEDSECKFIIKDLIMRRYLFEKYFDQNDEKIQKILKEIGDNIKSFPLSDFKPIDFYHIFKFKRNEIKDSDDFLYFTKLEPYILKNMDYYYPFHFFNFLRFSLFKKIGTNAFILTLLQKSISNMNSYSLSILINMCLILGGKKWIREGLNFNHVEFIEKVFHTIIIHYSNKTIEFGRIKTLIRCAHENSISVGSLREFMLAELLKKYLFDHNSNFENRYIFMLCSLNISSPTLLQRFGEYLKRSLDNNNQNSSIFLPKYNSYEYSIEEQKNLYFWIIQNLRDLWSYLFMIWKHKIFDKCDFDLVNNLISQINNLLKDFEYEGKGFYFECYDLIDQINAFSELHCFQMINKRILIDHLKGKNLPLHNYRQFPKNIIKESIIAEKLAFISKYSDYIKEMREINGFHFEISLDNYNGDVLPILINLPNEYFIEKGKYIERGQLTFRKGMLNENKINFVEISLEDIFQAMNTEIANDETIIEKVLREKIKGFEYEYPVKDNFESEEMRVALERRSVFRTNSNTKISLSEPFVENGENYENEENDILEISSSEDYE